MAKVRAHVMLPEELVDEIDELVGKRHRSDFLAEAAELRLRNVRLSRALQRIREHNEPVAVEGWDDPERWVREQRALDSDPWGRENA
jgi:Arc/MetJ-type ribon-helix-helix transcriptional regulator